MVSAIGRRVRREDARLGYWLVLPILAVMGLFVYYPSLMTLAHSFTSWNLRMPGMSRFLGLQNYARILAWPEFWAALERTLVVLLITLPLEFAIGIMGALVLNEDFRGRGLVRALAILPWMLPPLANGFMWGWLLNGEFGALNGLLYQLGFIREYVNWMGSPNSQLFWVSVAQAWTRYPFVMLILLAGLQSIPPDIYEAARIDGSSGWKTFRHITLPSLRPALSLAFIVEFIFTFQIFDVVWSLTSGGTAGTVINPFTKTVMVLNYQVVFRNMTIGFGAALAYVIMLISLVAGMFMMRRLHEGASS